MVTETLKPVYLNQTIAHHFFNLGKENKVNKSKHIKQNKNNNKKQLMLKLLPAIDDPSGHFLHQRMSNDPVTL